MSGAIYIVHCIDTEGPLAEHPFGLDYPNFSAVYHPDFTDLETLISTHRGQVLGCWRDIIEMLRRATSPGFRNELPDSNGQGWLYNWFCMDHLGYVDNPRQRTIGAHNIHDVYQRLAQQQQLGDTIHWHFHPMSTYREANKCATSYLNSPELFYLLSRRLIDRSFFPRANRSGFQDQRPDSHWFLEQYIPFDFSNLAVENIDYDNNPDMLDGRFNDWRWAPADWSTYHPHHDSYQAPGNCRRKIARCLNVLSRFANLDKAEMYRAYERAESGLNTLVSFSGHDWRDLAVEVMHVRHLIEEVRHDFPNVKFYYSDPVSAFNAVHPAKAKTHLALNIDVRRNDCGHPLRLDVTTTQGKIFGPQPFLAIKTRSRRYIHDNFNLSSPDGSFNYQFDSHSISPDDVAAIGVAANDDAGNQVIEVLNFNSRV
jgi:hypothetical protein